MRDFVEFVSLFDEPVNELCIVSRKKNDAVVTTGQAQGGASQPGAGLGLGTPSREAVIDQEEVSV